MISTISSRLAWGIGVFTIGLIVAGVFALLLLLRAERGTQEEDAARRILRNSALPLLIQFVVRGIDFAFVMVLYRVALPDALGDYELAALLVTLYLATISEWGLGILLTREVARDRTALRNSFGTALLLRLGLSLISIPVALLVVAAFHGLYAAGVIASTITGQGTTLILILVLTLAPGAIGAAVTSVYLAVERPIIPALANMLNNVVSTLLRLLALVLGFGVVGVAWAALGATLLNAFVFAWLFRRDFGWPGWQWDSGLARLLLSAAFPLMLNSLLVGVFFRFDTFIIKAYHDSAAVGVYGAAYKVAPLALILPPIVVNALFPRFSRQADDDRAGLLRGYRLTLRILLLGTLPFVGAGSVYAPELVGLIAGVDFIANAGPILAVLIWFVPLSYVNGVTQYVLIALRRQGTITIAFAITALFNLGVNLALIPRWGLLAAAATTIASEAVLYLPFRRVLIAELHAAPLLDIIWRPALATGISMLVMWYLRAWPLPGIIAGGAIYIVVLGALRTFTADDRALLRRLIGRTSG